MASAVDVYCIKQRDGSMTSFTLVDSGEERSQMRRHLSGLFLLGITPMGLV